MAQTLVTTPFGRRRMTLGLVATQIQARAPAESRTIHKWKVFQSLTTAKDRLGLPDRALTVLNALLSFHQETTMTAGDPLIVFPSNAKLSARAHGVAPATLRRHLAILVEAGLVIRRDSPNGKRYARRGQGGELSDAFGFDLSPLVTRAEEFEALAEDVEAERKALRLARERITLARRDIGKMIALAIEEGIPGNWASVHARFLTLAGGIGRSSGLPVLAGTADALEALTTEIASHLENFINSSNISAKESHSERHKQNSKSDPQESEPASEKARSEGAAEPQPLPPVANDPEDEGIRRGSVRTPLAMVLDACPDILDYVPDAAGRERPDWNGFIRTAELVRAMLGISPDAWHDAVETMGLTDAAIVVAAILQKGDDIRFPGGYLRALTEKKRAGTFSVGPILMALINGRGRPRGS